MSFALPEYDVAAKLRFRVAMEALIVAIEPALRAFKVVEVESVPTARIPVDETHAVELPPKSVEHTVRFHRERTTAGDLSTVYESLTRSAAYSAEARLAYMKANLDTMTAATGNVMKVDRDLNWDDVMTVVEAAPIAFDDDGESTMTFWPPHAQAAFDALPPRDEDQERRWRQLMDTKRKEAHARERDRRLR